MMLCVTDTGVGIAAEDLARIGDPFFQAGKTYQRKHEGTGLGLSIVKGLVGLHNGEMNVQSTVGEGTTVTVTLPLDFAPLLTPSNNVAPLKPALRSGSQDQVHQVKKRA
jgi:cell cycle sensor histidine kinase DivJ